MHDLSKGTTRGWAAPGGRTLLAAAATAAIVLSGVALAPAASASPGQAVADLGTITANDLVTQILGTGITVSNVQYVGDPAAAGTFSGLGAVGFDAGITLGSGRAADVVGPNDSASKTTAFGTPGDTDLDGLTGGFNTRDASVLSFDFVPTTSEVKFEYVFASDEYSEFSNTAFNDVFVFLVNGTNCALTPTGEPVSINTINNGNPGGDTTPHNPELFRDNTPNDEGVAPVDAQADGLTTVMQCAAAVTANAPNTMKLAIADTTDSNLDSSVFIRAGSLRINRAPVASDVSATTAQDTPVGVTLSATDADSDPLTYAVVTGPAHGTLSGTGANLTYTPTPGYSGPDTFTYRANDGQADSNLATASITVTPVVAPPASAPVLDVRVSKDQKTASSKITSPSFSTQAGGRLVLAFITADGPNAATQRITGVTGGGLTWTLVKRANATWGTAEVWQAYATAPLAAAAVTAKFAKSGYDGSITVAAFSGAATQVGASAAKAGTSGAPTVSVTPTAANSLIWATGHDWSSAAKPVAGAGQTFVHTFIDTRVRDSFWVQRLSAPTAGTSPVIISDTSPTKDRWQLVAVEIPPAA